MALTFEELNENQKQAANWDEGPILVLAGPGSGKTAVLTLRIARLIKDSPEENFKVLGLTFTVKAANEMNKRLVELLGEKSKRVQLKTFHSFCTDLLRQHGSHLGLKPDFSVITDDKDRSLILKSLNDNMIISIDEPEDSLKVIDIMFINGILPEELDTYFEPNQKDVCEKLKSVFKAYVEELIKNNQLDFNSMIYFTRKLLSSKERIARQVRIVYKYICVDEFQDTNLAQYQILKHIATGPDSNLFVVADDDQVIFQWNGADPKRLDELKSDYQPEILQLPENYRCPTEIVQIANLLIQNNSGRIDTKIAGVSHKDAKGVINLCAYNSLDDEIEGLSSEILKVDKTQRANCLVIARSNKMLVQVKKVLTLNNIEAEIVNKSQDFSSNIFLFLYHILKLSNSPESRSILNKLCSIASKLTEVVFSGEEIATQSHVDGKGFLRTLLRFASKSELLDPITKIANDYLLNGNSYQLFFENSISYIESKYVASDLDEVFPDFKADKSNWQRILWEINNNYGENVNLHTFLQEFDLTPKEKPLSRTCVRLQTVHTAKGMEFEYVYVIGLAEDQFPTYFSIRKGPSAIEEERRNCFVAITRTSKTLYLSYAKHYYGWPKKPSRFLYEMKLLF